MTDILYGRPPAVFDPPTGATQTSPLIPGSTALEDLAPGSVETATIYAPPGVVERRYTLALALRALKPGGLIILEAFHRDQLGRTSGGPKDVAMLFDLALLAEDFGSDIRAVHGFEGDIDLDEGRGHIGRGAIVRFVGVRI